MSQRQASVVRRLVLILLLVFSAALPYMQLSSPAFAQANDTTVLYLSPATVSSTKPAPGFTPSFSLNVNLNLSSTDTVAGYDIYMSYNNTVLNATGLHPGNLFPSDRIVNATYCVNDLGYNCTGLDSVNVVHWSVAYLDGALSGPLYGRTVFAVQFSVLTIGHSVFQFFNDTIWSDIQPSSGAPAPVLHLSDNGVYSNDGLQAFFNVAPAILLVNTPVYFDASTSFNPENSSGSYRSGLTYRWDFGDGNTEGGEIVSHVYASARTYRANLVVTDASGAASAISRLVMVVPALGGLRISIKDMSGNEVLQTTTLKLFNGSLLVTTLTRQAGNTDPFVVSGLLPGVYRLDFSGSGITPLSKQENVLAGWMSTDIVYLTVQTLTPTGSSDLLADLIVGAIVAVVLVGAVSIIHGRLTRRRSRLSSQKNS